MEKLNELEIIAKSRADNFEPCTFADTKDILAIAKAFREMEKRAEAAEAALESESDIHIDTAASMREWRLRAEAAEALNKHLELAVRKAEAVSESLRRRAEDAENKLLFTRPAPAADLAALVPDEMTWNQAHSLLDINQCGEDRFYAFMMGANSCRVDILRKIEEAK